MRFDSCRGSLALDAKQRFEIILAQHRDAQFFGLGQLATGLGPSDKIIGLLRDARGRSAAVRLDQRVDFVTRVLRQRTGYDQRLALQLISGRDLVAIGHIHTDSSRAQLLDRRLAVGLVQELMHAMGNDFADFGRLGDLLDGGRFQRLHRAKVIGEDLRHGRSHMANR